MKNDIITNVKETMKEAKKYYKQFDKYNYLWLTNKNEHLNEFLNYGRLLTVQEKAQFLTNDPPNIRHQAPDMAAFRNQVKSDSYFCILQFDFVSLWQCLFLWPLLFLQFFKLIATRKFIDYLSGPI